MCNKHNPIKRKLYLIISLCACAAIWFTGCANIVPADSDISDMTITTAEPSETAPATTSAETTAVTETPATEPVTEPVTEEVTEPVTEEVTEPVTEEVTQESAGTSVSTNETQPEQTEEEDNVEQVDSDYYFQNEDDYFFIVNKQHFLPEDYEIETDYVQGSYEMEKTAAYYCRQMIEAAAEDGINLKVISAYRTVSYQEKLFERNVQSRMDGGMSYEEAYYDTSINIAPPGGSEHNAGLAADIVPEDDWDTYTGFEDTEEFAWLSEHAAEYGFIMRYPKGKEDITGYIYEPWHYRYVGVKYAADVAQSGLCLEEYFDKYYPGWSDEQ